MHTLQRIDAPTAPGFLPVKSPDVPTVEATDDGFGFDDLLDVINPLQHLPVVGMLYRSLSGDEIEPPARIAGGALFGGVYGALGALGSVFVEAIAGRSIENMIAGIFDTDEEEPVSASNQHAAKAYAASAELSEFDIERKAMPTPLRMAALDLVIN